MVAAARFASQAVVREQLLPLNPGDIQGVCVLTMDLLEQIEDQAARPPAMAGRPVGIAPPPQAMDPHTKILAAAQRDDAVSIRKFLDEGVPPSYANSLGQTPLHIVFGGRAGRGSRGSRRRRG